MQAKEKKEIFSKKEVSNGRIRYFTKVLSDIFYFKEYSDKLYMKFRGLFKLSSIYTMSIFNLKQGDAFEGIYFGFNNIKNNPIKKEYFDGHIKKTLRIQKTYYIEIRFLTGSIFLYLQALALLLNPNKRNNNYCIKFKERLNNFIQILYKRFNTPLEVDLLGNWIKRQDIIRTRNIELFKQKRKNVPMRGRNLGSSVRIRKFKPHFVKKSR